MNTKKFTIKNKPSIFRRFLNSFEEMRFKYTLPLHQKATGNKAYKWWSEKKFTNPVHYIMLLGFFVGILSGLGVSLPRGVFSFLSGEKIMTQFTTSSLHKSEIDINSEYIVWTEIGDQDMYVHYYDRGTGEEVRIPTSHQAYWSAIYNDEVFFYLDNSIKVYNITSGTTRDVMTGFNGNINISNNKIVGVNYYYDLLVDTDGDGIFNYQEEIKPSPDPAYVTEFSLDPYTYYGGASYGDYLIYHAQIVNSYYVYVYDTAVNQGYVIPAGNGNAQAGNSYSPTVDESGVVTWLEWKNDFSSELIYKYDLTADTDNNGTPNFKEGLEVDPALTIHDPGITPINYFATGGDLAVIVSNADGADNYYSYNYQSDSLKSITTQNGAYNPSASISGDTIAFVMYPDRGGAINGYTTKLEIDNDEPYFSNLPGESRKINYNPNQFIQRSDIDVRVRPGDSTSNISRVKFFIEDFHLDTVYTANQDGVYSANIIIPKNKEGGVNLIARAYDQSNNYKDYSVKIVPDPMIFPYVTITNLTPSNGVDSWAGDERRPRYDGSNLWFGSNNGPADTAGIYISKNGQAPMQAFSYFGDAFYYNSLASSAKFYCNTESVGLQWPIWSNYIYCYAFDDSFWEFVLDSFEGGYGAFSVRVYGDYAYWTISQEGGSKIFRQNLAEGEGGVAELLYESPNYNISSIVVSDNYLYFQIYNNEGEHEISRINLGILGIPVVVAQAYISYYDANDDYLVYSGKDESGNNELVLIDIKNNDRKVVYSGPNRVKDVSVGQYFAAWEDEPQSTEGRVAVYDIQKDKMFYLNNSVYNNEHNQYSDIDAPFVYGNKIFWNAEDGDGDEDIYMATLEYADIIKPEITSVTGLYGTTGETATVKMTATDNVKATRGKISINGGNFVDMNGFQSPFSYTVSIPEGDASPIPIKIRAYDIAGNFVEKSYSIIVADNDTPFVASIEGNRVTTGESTIVRVKAFDNISIAKAEINIDNTGFKLMTKEGEYYVYQYTAPTNKAGNLSLRVRITDSSGKIYEKSNGVMIVTDNDPPEITKVESPDEVEERGSGTVTVYATDNIAPVKGMITFDGVLWEDMIGTKSPFTFDLANRIAQNQDDLEFYVRVYDAAGNYDTTEPDKIPFVNTTSTAEEGESEPESQGTAPSALAVVQAAFTDIIKNTPEPVAKSFPYLLFLALIASALVFTIQARKEAEQATTKLEMIGLRKIVAGEKSNFIMLISHYLRTPLTLINAGIEEMKASKTVSDVAVKLKNVIQDTINSIERDIEVKKLTDPNIKVEGAKVYFSPFIVISAVSIAIIAFGSNYIFKHVNDYEVNTLNMVTQLIVFLIAIQLFAYQYRKKAIQKNNLKYFNETVEYQVAVDEARSRLMVSASTDIKKALVDLKKALGKKSNEYVAEGTLRLEGLLQKMGYLSTLKYEDINKEKKSYSVSALLEAILKRQDAKIKKKNLRIDLSSADIKSRKNKKIVMEVISEIIDNAVKFAPEGSVVRISGFEKDGEARIMVEDTGKGISKKEQLYIFKPFSKSNDAIDFTFEGVGLGMYYARSLSNMLGGEILLESREGKGTKVTIVL